MRVGLLAATLLATSCGDGGAIDGPTVLLDLVVTEFSFSGPNQPASGRTVCLIEPVEGRCETSGDDGFVTLEVPQSSNVVLRTEGPDDFPGLLAITVGTEDLFLDMPVYTRALVEGVAIAYDTEVDPALGQVTMAASPAIAANAGHEYVFLDPDTEEPTGSMPFYLSEEGLPDSMASATPTNGYGGVTNAAPGDYLLVVPMNEHCSIFRGWEATTADGAPAMRVPVRAGTITTLQWVDCTPP